MLDTFMGKIISTTTLLYLNFVLVSNDDDCEDELNKFCGLKFITLKLVKILNAEVLLSQVKGLHK